MLGFIDAQTKWYLDKAKALDKVTNQMEMMHPDGLRRRQFRFNKAIHMMKFLIDVGRSATLAFSESINQAAAASTTFAGMTSRLNQAQELGNAYLNYRRGICTEIDLNSVRKKVEKLLTIPTNLVNSKTGPAQNRFDDSCHTLDALAYELTKQKPNDNKL